MFQPRKKRKKIQMNSRGLQSVTKYKPKSKKIKFLISAFASVLTTTAKN